MYPLVNIIYHKSVSTIASYRWQTTSWLLSCCVLLTLWATHVLLLTRLQDEDNKMKKTELSKHLIISTAYNIN